MPYTMFIYDKKDKSSVPEIGDLFKVTDITHGVQDYSIGGGRGTWVKVEPIDGKCPGCEESTGETKLWCCHHCGMRMEDF